MLECYTACSSLAAKSWTLSNQPKISNDRFETKKILHKELPERFRQTQGRKTQHHVLGHAV